MKTRDILDPRRITLKLEGKTKREILGQLADMVGETHSAIDPERVAEVLVEREQASSTAIADGIAIPHGKVAMSEEVVACLGLSGDGLDFDSVDSQPTHIFFVLVSPEAHPSLHLRWLAHLAHLLTDEQFRHELLACSDVDEVMATISEAEDRSRETESAISP
ncbi:MAG: PTS sugar transporter subunit IIA [Proteobacteria bacterium]|nr:PTS sugar transporter subunit IIA [Pseudomonadota bacterium]